MVLMGKKKKVLLLLNVLALVGIFMLFIDRNGARFGDLFAIWDATVVDYPRAEMESPETELEIEPEIKQESEPEAEMPEKTNGNVEDILRERLNYLEEIVYGHLNGLSKPLGLVEGFGAKGADGVPFTLSVEEATKAGPLKQKYGYDAFMSDKISLDRNIPDYRPSKCKEYTYPADLPQIALIFIFVNEALSVILRSIHSAVNHTPAHLLKEIILVDDHSDQEQLKGPLEDYVNKRYPGLVKIIRNSKREGLIRARIEGWKAATAEVTGFFDAHVEFTPFWAEPVLSRIKEDRTRIILPSIDNIKYDTFEVVSYGQPAHGYDWQLWCKYISPNAAWKALNDESLPIRSPAMIGCSFVVHRLYFGELGLFDPEMEVYGGENVELGIRVWSCGGSMEMLPCSRVAHIQRFKKPYLEDSLATLMRRNGLRVAEVWFDEYKPNFYMAWNIPMKNHSIDYGNVTERVELRKRLQCKNFKWYLENVYPEMRTHQDTLIYGVMYNFNLKKMCLDQGERIYHTPILFHCHGLNPQLVRYTSSKQLFVGTLGSSSQETRCLVDIPSETRPQLLDCNTVSNIRQTKWKFIQGDAVQNIATGRCMEVVKSEPNKDNKLVMRRCSGQRWNLTIPALRS
ncbi:polypeptide N-acetylgalactosaminyltransferase 17-like [Syngnathoides biaculeatus]|uniref:polypeptide N-acetylgalactosaminyltransferase 17-like n=1 Tax=Syngnathoides biaculeatus TaxID=300417 RepID=UPI002ADD5332|nr:polypeptide N-acetylgalactosaminyltransferase 17-like [Syngnathoides biaculeatus]